MYSIVSREGWCMRYPYGAWRAWLGYGIIRRRVCRRNRGNSSGFGSSTETVSMYAVQSATSVLAASAHSVNARRVCARVVTNGSTASFAAFAASSSHRSDEGSGSSTRTSSATGIPVNRSNAVKAGIKPVRGQPDDDPRGGKLVSPADGPLDPIAEFYSWCVICLGNNRLVLVEPARLGGPP